MTGEQVTSPGLVLVSGSSGNIGAATARLFLDRGFEVVGLDNRKPDTMPLGSFHHVTVDLADERATAQAVAEITAAAPVQHVCGIAGGALPDDGGATGWQLPTPEVFRASIERNLLSQYHLVHAALPALEAARGDRSITLCSSVNALGAWARPAYSTAKAGLLGLTRVLAEALGPRGIRVNCVAPGSVLDEANGAVGRESNGSVIRELERTIPLGRAAHPVDVARCFVTLALDLTHVHGETLVVDGGQEIRRRSRTS
ncbi:hypothetical protein TH66_13010 [Carbonactinospora thermoautotrophica]|uniref:3-oxoacyl-(Acyl-carrier protein) reductase n=1 Tax=Carbonactinospora thermoautotrophica TaxID=1469144 RepID=A0A132MXW9_9ACTN|nr:SDR family oxidoreductase [Carbonactinospora thermoautotrophica]KWX02667.1 3-oxoacyl-(acyl-carrier protein) reductase [Carbonactinospora thermoautotrophica]KWX03712.1 hypothetical protein TH66_13010 [Carbonactinospora thermoautotrophica]